MPESFTEYFRCPAAALPSLFAAGHLSEENGFFRFGSRLCYGRCAGARPSPEITDRLPDVSGLTRHHRRGVAIPFDFSEVVCNLREEQYQLNGYPLLERLSSGPAARQMYYFLRPMLRVGVRKHLQKIRLSGWQSIRFPSWPVDSTVDELMESAMALLLESGGRPIPFIWFWPDGARSCAVMTHDVEGKKGRDFCDELMDLDESYGIRSAFQLIPEGQETVWRELGGRMRSRGFEVNLHDLNHDGYLFHNRELFQARARKINEYAREFDCGGFRSGAMYRDQRWYEEFEFSYDMSVPNVAHLEPQRGGCCTVMPYFVGDVLELPLTTLQDYSLFHILDDYSIGLWEQQVRAILRRNGLMTFLTHPDYLTTPRAMAVYTALLSYLRGVRTESNVWAALPADVDRWWRSRQQMSLVQDGNSWRIDGPDAHRARVAYAVPDGDGVGYELDQPR